MRSCQLEFTRLPPVVFWQGMPGSISSCGEPLQTFPFFSPPPNRDIALYVSSPNFICKHVFVKVQPVVDAALEEFVCVLCTQIGAGTLVYNQALHESAARACISCISVDFCLEIVKLIECSGGGGTTVLSGECP